MDIFIAQKDWIRERGKSFTGGSFSLFQNSKSNQIIIATQSGSNQSIDVRSMVSSSFMGFQFRWSFSLRQALLRQAEVSPENAWKDIESSLPVKILQFHWLTSRSRCPRENHRDLRQSPRNWNNCKKASNCIDVDRSTALYPDSKTCSSFVCYKLTFHFHLKTQFQSFAKLRNRPKAIHSRGIENSTQWNRSSVLLAIHSATQFGLV